MHASFIVNAFCQSNQDAALDEMYHPSASNLSPPFNGPNLSPPNYNQNRVTEQGK